MIELIHLLAIHKTRQSRNAQIQLSGPLRTAQKILEERLTQVTNDIQYIQAFLKKEPTHCRPGVYRGWDRQVNIIIYMSGIDYLHFLDRYTPCIPYIAKGLKKILITHSKNRLVSHDGRLAEDGLAIQVTQHAFSRTYTRLKELEQELQPVKNNFDEARQYMKTRWQNRPCLSTLFDRYILSPTDNIIGLYGLSIIIIALLLSNTLLFLPLLYTGLFITSWPLIRYTINHILICSHINVYRTCAYLLSFIIQRCKKYFVAEQPQDAPWKLITETINTLHDFYRYHIRYQTNLRTAGLSIDFSEVSSRKIEAPISEHIKQKGHLYAKLHDSLNLLFFTIEPAVSIDAENKILTST